MRCGWRSNTILPAGLTLLKRHEQIQGAKPGPAESGEISLTARATTGQPPFLVAPEISFHTPCAPRQTGNPGIISLSYRRRGRGSAWIALGANSEGHPVRACPTAGWIPVIWALQERGFVEAAKFPGMKPFKRHFPDNFHRPDPDLQMLVYLALVKGGCHSR